MEPYAGKARVPKRRSRRAIPREDFIAPHDATSYAIAIDPSGKLTWREADIDGEHVITVLTEAVSDDLPRVPAADGRLVPLRRQGAHRPREKVLGKRANDSASAAAARGRRQDQRLVPRREPDRRAERPRRADRGRQHRHADALRRRGRSARAELKLLSMEKRPGGIVWLRYKVRPLMQVFEIVIALLLGGALLPAVARRIATPYPALVAIAGAALALVPSVPTLVLDPQLALALFVAPVLLDAAFDASQRDLRENWRAVAGLAIGAVLLTSPSSPSSRTRWCPDSPGPPHRPRRDRRPPDAAAATAVLKQLRPPNRLLVVLEGESLFNDASALLIYRFAVAAAAAGLVSGWAFAGSLVAIGMGSIVLALVLSRVTVPHDAHPGRRARRHRSVLQHVRVWILAERLHLSGILTMVVFAMAVSRPAARRSPRACACRPTRSGRSRCSC
jgi:hypothetical protein